MATTAEEKKWQAENDARTLADAEVIKKDGVRLGEAAKAAKTMAEEQQEKATALARIAKLRSTTTRTRTIGARVATSRR